jgi:alkanesulfonate monooxygenase SsuD/methylene tetrahydromethanopterin reductase-like flavin-dependent oxidoreductase (luciferase family)
VHLGVAIFPTDETPAPDDVARMVEERGFESLFFPEHTHIPASRETPYPAGGELPREYSRTLDPFIALTAAACATTTLRIGTGICLVIQRDPIVLAKEVASLDRVSGAASCSASARAGTARRCATTAPIRARGCGCCTSASTR